MKTISLNSPVAPFVFLALGSTLNEFTYENDFWLFRVIEIALFLMGILTALYNYSSKLKYVVSVMCLLGVLISGSELLRVHDQTKIDNSDTTKTISHKDSGFDEYHSDDFKIWGNGGIEIPIEKECYHCKGSGDCSDCNGTGKIALKRYGIDLGGGGSTYNEYQLCPLCNGGRDCIYCGGKGTITY